MEGSPPHYHADQAILCELAHDALHGPRRNARWMIVLNDDWADTDYDEELSQVMLSGGVYIAPLDTAKLCDPCTALLNLVWDAENQKDTCGTAAS